MLRFCPSSNSAEVMTGLKTNAADRSDNWHFWHAGAPDPSILLWTPGNPVEIGNAVAPGAVSYSKSVALMTSAGLINDLGTDNKQFFCEIQVPSKPQRYTVVCTHA